MNSTEPTDENIYIEEPKNGLFYCVNNFLKNMFKQDNKKIGELNGKWAFMLKAVLTLFLILTPTFCGWCIWVTNSIFEQQNQYIEVRSNFNHLLEKTNELPPRSGCVPTEEWRNRIEKNETKTDKFIEQLYSIDKKNEQDHGKILKLLEGIKTSLDSVKKQ